MFESKLVDKNILICLDTLHKMVTQKHITLGTRSLYLEAESLLINNLMNSKVKNNTRGRLKRKQIFQGILTNKFKNYDIENDIVDNEAAGFEI